MKVNSFVTSSDEINIVINLIPALKNKLNLSDKDIIGLKKYISGESIKNADEESNRLFESFIDKLTKTNRFGFEDISVGFPNNVILYVSADNINFLKILKKYDIAVRTPVAEIEEKLMKKSAKIANLIRELDLVANSFERNGDIDLAREIDEISNRLSKTETYQEFVEKKLPELEKDYKDKAVDELNKEWKKTM